MSGNLMHQPGRFPVFASRPTTDFVRRWQRHIETTGKPETFECISIDKPARGATVRLLSSDIAVPLSKRGGERVPCPLCSPSSPKFGVGRMAWFPDEMAARFIGHTCAKRFLGENYRVAERQFRIEQDCQAYQHMWAASVPHLEALEAFIAGLSVPAKALQFTRDYLDRQAPGFARFLFSDRISSTGRLPFGIGPKAASGDLKGIAFLSPDFHPVQHVASLRAAYDDLLKALPDWTVEQGEDAAAREIMRRGRKVETALKRLPEIRARVAEAQRFIQPGNLRTLERWAKSGLSPFDVLTFRWKDNRIILRSASFDGAHHCELLVHPDWNADVPKSHKGLEI